MDWSIQKDLLSDLLNKTGFLDLGIVGFDGTAYYTDGSVENLAGRDHVLLALDGEASISDVVPEGVFWKNHNEVCGSHRKIWKGSRGLNRT